MKFFNTPFSRRPLWQLLTLLAVVTALPLLAASYFMFQQLTSNARQGIKEGLLVNARTLAALVDSEVDTHAAIAHTLSRSPALLRGDLPAFRAEAIAALTYVPGSWINVHRPDGAVVATTLREIEAPISPGADAAIVAKAFASKIQQVGNVEPGPINGQQRALVVIPVFDGDKPLYALAISLVPTRLHALIKNQFTQGEVVAILDRNRNFVARIPDHEKRVGTLASEGWRAAIARNPIGWTENRTVEGNWSVTGYAPTKHGWTAGIALLDSAIESPVQRIFWSSILAFLTFTALSLMLAAAIARHASRGMAQLAHGARFVGKGEVVTDFPAPFKEAQTIAVALEDASSELRRRGQALEQANSELELKVAERTQELENELHRREAAEATLRQSQKVEAIGQLTGGIAHDFNNMLTIILGNLDTLKRRTQPLEQAATLTRPLEAAMQGARNAAKLTHRLLAFSRQQPLEPQILDLNALVGGISDMVARTVGENIRVETVLGAGLWPVFADPSQIETSVVNLAVNARDAMPDGGKLTIETANAYLDEAYAQRFGDVTAGQYVMLCVSDTGTGIPPEKLERVFEPFFTTKEVGKGTGLGLAMVHGFVKQSNGHIRIYSEPGDGTAVKIYLPRMIGQSGAAAPLGVQVTNEDALPRARRGETILLVEDDDGVRDYAIGMLEDLGYKVLAVANGLDALTLLRTAKRVDLLFTDVVLGGALNGRQLADQATAEFAQLPVLFTTGYTRNAIVHEGRLDPGVNLLGKPYTQRSAAEKIRQMLDGRRG